MPGLFGFCCDEPQDKNQQRLDAGANTMRRQAWHKVTQCRLSSFAMAAASREGPMPGSDLWVAPDQMLAVAIDGEIYAAPHEPAGHSPDFPTARCAAYIGARYLREGPHWIDAVQGAFSVVIWDGSQSELWLFNDRYGFRPIHYAQWNGHFVFGSTLASFRSAWPDATWSVNLDAIADFLTFQHLLGEKTLLEQVSVLPNAARLRYRPAVGDASIDRYWCLENVRPSPVASYHEAVVEAGRLLDRAVERLVKGGRPGLYITAGLDSRILGGAMRKLCGSFPTFTYGIAGCRDAVWGTALANRLGCENHFFSFDDGAWLFAHAEDFVRATEGFVLFLHSHGISTFGSARERMDFHLSGMGGGSFLGGDTTSSAAAAAVDAIEMGEEMYKHYRLNLSNTYPTPYGLEMALHPDMRRDLRGRAEASFATEWNKFSHMPPDVAGDAFTLGNRYKKFFPLLAVVERDFFEQRLPYMDYDLLDFIFSLPVALKLKRMLQIGILDRFYPDLCLVPWQPTAELPTNRAWLSHMHYLVRKVANLAKRAAGMPVALPSEPGRNPPLWILQSGMRWCGEVFSSESFASRNVFDVGYHKNLLHRLPQFGSQASYGRQRVIAYQIGAAITIELALRTIMNSD